MTAQRALDELPSDELLTLSEAVSYLPSMFTISTLRTEINKGRLIPTVIARKTCVMVSDLQEFKQTCRKPRKVQGSSFTDQTKSMVPGQSEDIEPISTMSSGTKAVARSSGLPGPTFTNALKQKKSSRPSLPSDQQPPARPAVIFPIR